MKPIITWPTNPRPLHTFGDLKAIGDTFLFQEKLYMVFSSTAAIDLQTGGLSYFSDSVPVKPVMVHITVKEL